MSKPTLLNSIYIEETGAGFSRRPDYQGIAYSDGDQVEEEIEQIIDNCNDRSVYSQDLKRHMDSWAKKYHLSAGRSNLLRPLEHLIRGKRVLEIGSGCGAITRYLGEAGASVVALEGSARRARICSKRTKDLITVQVVCERFGDFLSDEQFDIVTLIGVLEYASIYGATSNPHLDMINRAKQFLKPEGIILIAIENQLGLKYFAGALEDHIGEPFYGVESHYTIRQAKTFGRKELQSLVSEAGFSYQTMMAPFPDYKLPTVLITETGFEEKRFNAAALICPTETSDEQSPELPVLSQFRTWQTVLRNGLGLDLSNSFLLMASDNPVEVDRSVLAHYFGIHRSQGKHKHSVFKLAQDDQLEVTESWSEANNSNTNASKPYIVDSTPLIHDLHNILTSRSAGIEDVIAFFVRYRTIVFQLASARDAANPILPANFLDAIPQNILIDRNNQPYLIDNEWVHNGELLFSRLLFRAVIYSLNGCRLIRLKSDEGEISLKNLMTRIYLATGLDISSDSLDSIAQAEYRFQSEIDDAGSLDHWKQSKDAPIRRPDIYISLASKARALDSATHIISTLKERETSLTVALKESINAIKGSNSWRITAPLRWISERFR